MTTFAACQGKPPEPKPTTGSISGKVTLADAPDAQDLSGTLVTLGKTLVVTNAQGAFQFDGIAPGDAKVRATRDGYVAQEQVVTVKVGEVASADFALAPPVVPDIAPVISSLSVQPQQLAPAGTASLVVVAADADGDALTYLFTADNGFTVEPSDEPGMATVTAPSQFDAKGTLTVIVDDGKGGTATGKLEISTSANSVPTLTSITATPSTVEPGKTLELTAVAKDLESADLGYTWTAPEGWTVSGTGATVSLQAPAQYGVSGIVTLEVADGNGGLVSGQVTVATVANARPVVTSVTATPAQVAPNGSIALAVSAYDPYADALSYTWTAPAGWTLSGTGAQVTLTAPAQYAQQGTVTVDVDDGHGASVQAQVVVSTMQNHAPVLASLTAAPPTVQKGGTVQLAASVSDPDGDALSYTWAAPAGWTLTANGAQAILVAPNSPALLGTVTLTVDDGNGGSVTGSIVVSTAANNGPLISSVTATPPTVQKGGSTQLAVSAADPDGDALVYAWTAPAGWTLTGSGAQVSLAAPNTPGATGSVQVTVTDATGAQATGSVVVSTRQNAAPVVSSITANPSTAAKGGTVTLTVSASDADNDSLSYTWTAPSGWPVTGTGAQVTLTAPGIPGLTGTARVTVTDSFGGSTQSSVVVSTQANAAPVISSVTANPASVAKGGVVSLSASANDADGDTLDYAWSVPAGWTLSGTGASVSLTAPNTPGVSGTVQVTVTDGFGGSTAGSVVVSTRANAAPSVASFVASPNPVAKGGAITLSVSASDADGDVLTYAYSQPAGWTVSGNGSTAAVTAPAIPGETATITVTVTDGFGGTVTSAVVVGTKANVVPQIAGVSATPSAVFRGTTLTATASASDADGDSLSYVWSVSDSSWQLSGSGASISVTAPNTYSATASLTVTVSDGFGGSASASTPVSTNANRPPVITSPVPDTGKVRDPIVWTVVASDPDGDPLTYSLGANAPASATIDPVTGVLTWTPSHLDLNFNFDVLASDGEFTAVQSAAESVDPVQFQSSTVNLPYSSDQGVADLNADGYDDAYRTGYDAAINQVLTTASASFGTPQLTPGQTYTPPGSGTNFRRFQDCRRSDSGDVDSDGDVDVLVACNQVIDTSTCRLEYYYGYYWTCDYQYIPTVVVYANDGTGSLTYSTYFSSSSSTTYYGLSSFELVDLDEDGDLDAVVAANGSYLGTWKNTAGSFAWGTVVTVGVNIGGAAVGDFDGNGLPDIVFSDNNNGRVTVIPVSSTGVPDNSLATSSTAITGASCMESPFLDDLDGDGDLDIAVWNRCGNAGLYTGINTGAGVPALSRIYIAAGCISSATMMSLADVDADGRKDFVASDACTYSQYHVIYNDGSGGADPAELMTGSNSNPAIEIIAGDFDGDGREDLYRFDPSNLSVYW